MDTWELFLQILGRSKSASMLSEVIDFPREMDLSRAMRLCPLQDPFRFRSRFVALEIANVLVDEAGNLQLQIAQKLLEAFQATPYLIGPHLESDALIFHHILSSLHALTHTDAIQKLFQKFSPPLCHEGANRLIESTLWPKPLKKIQVCDIKRAVLTAWFTVLRQTTGSCFATAPAILIQKKEPLQLLQDLFDLLTFGSLRRIIAGQEYAVPLCPSLEQFDLTRPLEKFSPQMLSIAPGLRAAFGAAGFPRLDLQTLIEEEKADTPKELIEAILLRLFELSKEEVLEEEALKSLDFNPLLAKQSAVFYQKPSPRAEKISLWKHALTKATTAYQALGDCALIRAWESTLASFSDVKLDVAKWNLYVSLGLHPDFPGGIAELAYNTINEELARFNQKIAELQSEYHHLEQMAYSAEKRGLSSEFSHAQYRATALRTQIEECVREGEKLSKIFPLLIEQYDKLLPESFQEIFDPSLAQNVAEMIDDSPAGFRLAHKHGRRASSQWTFIRSEKEFIHAAREFFEYSERELTSLFPDQRTSIETLTTRIIQYIQTPEFIKQSILRTQKNPGIHDPRAKPWEYISGGTMPALLMAYYNRHLPFSNHKKTIHNERELLYFLMETKREALIHSPTHAFIFLPDLLPSDPQAALVQMEKFWKTMKVKDPDWLIEKLAERLPEDESALFLHRWRQMGVKDDFPLLRNALIQLLGNHKIPFIDSFLWESLPLIDEQEAEGLGVQFVQPYMTPLEIRENIKALWMAKHGSVFSSHDLDQEIANLLRKRGLAAPQPILFADTNWSPWFFGLAFSPAGALNLWRFHRTAMSGVPMNHWFQLQCGGEWVILNRPEEYIFNKF